MLQYVLAACVLASPSSMLAMAWFMRGHRGRGDEK
jgi:hypothetical protein